jgi:hypothetical protein
VLIFGEFYTRFFAPEPLMPRYVTGSDFGIRKNIPNSTYRQKTTEVDVEIRINEQGFRADKTYPKVPDKSVCRITIFGDSFFMGYEVNLEDSFAFQLENQLYKQGINAEVINLSVSGFGTAENLISLNEIGFSFNPDVVIFEWHESDINDNLRSRLYKIEDDKLQRDAKVFLPAINTRNFLMQFSAYRWLIGNSHLYSVIREKTAIFIKKLLVWLPSILANRNPDIKVVTSAETTKDTKNIYQLKLSKMLLSEANRVTKLNEASFVLLDIPLRRSREKYLSSFDVIRNYLDEKMILISPIDLFHKKANKDTKIYYEEGHGHLSPLGNQLLAAETTKSLIKNNLFNDCLINKNYEQ